MKQITARKRIQYFTICPYCARPDDILFFNDNSPTLEIKIVKCWHCKKEYEVLNPDKK